MKLLLHTCCTPCSVYCIESLRKEGIEPILYWYNPNIHPYKEYELRKNCLIDYAKKINAQCIIEDEYGLDTFCKNVSNSISTRCVDYCYPIRLRRLFEYAKQNGYDAVCTTLLYSIYQKHDFIKKYMEKLSKEYNIEFLYRDFRHGFWYGNNKAKELGLYMQKYCGCLFSIDDVELKRKNNEIKLPDGYEFLPARRSVVIKKEKENKDKYFDLLFDAYHSKEDVSKYLKEGEVFILKYKENIACISVITKVDDKTVELRIIKTKEEYQNQGFAKKIIKYLEDNYKQKYEKIVVGTTENSIPFFVKLGFDKFEKKVKGDIKSINKYYYSKYLG